MSTAETISYASPEDVLRALDKDPEMANATLTDRAEKRAAAATQKWINRTGRPFHAVRVGDPDESRSWETHDTHDVETFDPITIYLDNGPVMPLDPSGGDTLEVRVGRDDWRDITADEGDEWTLDYRTKRLTLYRRRRFHRMPYDDPRQRVVRLTYRYGPLGKDVTIDDTGVVTTVPADVRGAVAAKAASLLTLNDESKSGFPDEGQLTNRTSKRDALNEEWESAVAEYSGFSTL